MAEKTTAKAKVVAATAAAATPPPPKTKITKVDKFYHVKNVAEGEKLAPQARVIVNELSGKTEGLSRADLITALTGKVTTRQPVERILTYYQKQLVTSGYIRVESTEVKTTGAAAPEASA